MRYQLRLIGEDLVDLHAHLSRRCWSVLQALLPEKGRWGAYRALRRDLKAILSSRVEVREYCGQAHTCDSFLGPVEPGRPYRKNVPAVEALLTNHYLVSLATSPGPLVGELSRACLSLLAKARPGEPIKGAGRRIRRVVRSVILDRLYRNEACGESPLCGISNPVDPWARRAVKGTLQFTGDGPVARRS